MKYGSFSDAIRAADGLFIQHYDGPGSGERVCAITAGLTMLTGGFRARNEAHVYDMVMARFPYLWEAEARCPECHENGSLIYLLIHLNDVHRANFLQIAEWLRVEEDKAGYVTLVESDTDLHAAVPENKFLLCPSVS